MKRANRIVPALVLAGLAALFLPFPASAAGHGGTGAFELYAGYYFPDSSLLDDDVTYGVRGAFHWNDTLASEVTVGRYDQSFNFGGVAGIDFELTLVDLSTAWTFNPGSQAEFSVFAGPGWAFVDVSAQAFGFQVANASDDSFTLHVGADLQIALTNHIYLRPDARARWFEEGDDSIDLEASIGLGFRIGS